MAQVPVAFRNPKDDYDMILVPAGDAIIGSDENDPDASADERPQITVDLPAYYLGLYAVTNEQYREFVRATGHRTPGPPNWSKPVWDGLSFPREVANHPVVCVSLDDAAAYCEWAGLRLPTEIEWEKAARGADGRVFPWGNEWDPSRCHSSANKGHAGPVPYMTPATREAAATGATTRWQATRGSGPGGATIRGPTRSTCAEKSHCHSLGCQSMRTTSPSAAGGRH